MQKSTSLQAWDRKIRKISNKYLRIEHSKDREIIYAKLSRIGLTTERLVAVDPKSKSFENDFKQAVKTLGTPYWISAVSTSPDKVRDRLTLLDIRTRAEGWKFVTETNHLQDYKILVIQYPTKIIFKGSALVSKTGKGMVEFVKGDHHFDLISGKALTDPMLFDKRSISHYSEAVAKRYQDELFDVLGSHAGHFEFQYGLLDDKNCLSFFDYNDEIAYEDIDDEHESVLTNIKKRKNKQRGVICEGLTASVGKSQGRVKIILASEVEKYKTLKKGEVLVTDQTTPDMTPMMTRASAIVTDLGGVTSHAAIVCREMGIPCLVGTKDATSVLRGHKEIIVDATAGVVRRSD